MDYTDPRSDSAKARAYRELAAAIVDLGFPEEFAEVLAGELGGESSMRRMAAYLRGARPQSPEQIADELVAIVEQRDRWREKAMSERAQATMTSFYNRPGRDG